MPNFIIMQPSKVDNDKNNIPVMHRSSSIIMDDNKTTVQTAITNLEKNIDNIIIVPISFISDHIETLIEVDEQLIPILKNTGKNIVRMESLNDSPDFIDALSDIINI